MKTFEKLHTQFKLEKDSIVPAIVWIVWMKRSWSNINVNFGNVLKIPAIKDRCDNTYEGHTHNRYHRPELPMYKVNTKWKSERFLAVKCLAIKMCGRSDNLFYIPYDADLVGTDIKVIQGMVGERYGRVPYSDVNQHMALSKESAQIIVNNFEVDWLNERKEEYTSIIAARKEAALGAVKEAERVTYQKTKEIKEAVEYAQKEVKIEEESVPKFEAELKKTNELLKQYK